jgi:hypothetical protein
LFKIVRVPFVAAVLIVPVLVGCQPTASVVAPTAIAPRASLSAVGTPTAAPASPTIDAVGHLFSSDVGRDIAAGRYAVGKPFVASFTFEVPAGFAVDALREGNVAVSGSSGYLGAFAVDAVFEDPCKSDGTKKASRSDELLAALEHMKGFTAGDITESTLGGRRTRSFALSNAIDTAAAQCVRDGNLPLFTSRGNPAGESTNGGTRQVVWVVDGARSTGVAPGYEGPILIVADGYDTDAHLAVLEEMVASFEFK